MRMDGHHLYANTWLGVCHGLEVVEMKWKKREREGQPKERRKKDNMCPYVVAYVKCKLPTPIAHTYLENIYKVIIHAHISLNLIANCVQVPLFCGLPSSTYYLVGISPHFWCLSLSHDLNGTLPLSTRLCVFLPNHASSIGSISTQVICFKLIFLLWNPHSLLMKS